MSHIDKEHPIKFVHPALPPLEELQPFLESMWKSGAVTNNGPFQREFEEKLATYLGVKYVSLVSNGTLALTIALRALGITGKVITTPFTFAATTHALWWNGLEPVFVDVEPKYLTLDPAKVSDAIASDVSAIVPVHTYGNPCDVETLQRVADEHGVKLVYDAAPAFGVELGGNSVLNFGNASILSFHATKVFNTLEGGAIICNDEETKERIDSLRNFGFVDEITVIEPGINAKLTEVQAAVGLLQLPRIDTYIAERQRITNTYRDQLRQVRGISVFEDMPKVRHNYSYYPVRVNTEAFGKSRDQLHEELKEYGVTTRKYFFPLVTSFPKYCDIPSAQLGSLPVAEQVVEEVLCFPIYPALSDEAIAHTVETIKKLAQ